MEPDEAEKLKNPAKAKKAEEPKADTAKIDHS